MPNNIALAIRRFRNYICNFIEKHFMQKKHAKRKHKIIRTYYVCGVQVSKEEYLRALENGVDFLTTNGPERTCALTALGRQRAKWRELFVPEEFREDLFSGDCVLRVFAKTTRPIPEGHIPDKYIPQGTKCEVIGLWLDINNGFSWRDGTTWPERKYAERVFSGEIPDDENAIYVKFYNGLDGRVVHASDICEFETTREE